MSFDVILIYRRVGDGKTGDPERGKSLLTGVVADTQPELNLYGDPQEFTILNLSQKHVSKIHIRQ